MLNNFFEKKVAIKIFVLATLSSLIILLFLVPNVLWTPLCGEGSRSGGGLFDHGEHDISSGDTGYSIIWGYNTNQEEFGIYALVMNNSNKLKFVDDYDTFFSIFNQSLFAFYLALTNLSYFSLSIGINPRDSGTWLAPYKDTWHFVLVNNHPSNETLSSFTYNICFNIMNFPNHRLYSIIVLILIVSAHLSVAIDYARDKKGKKKGKFIAILISSFIICFILLTIFSLFVTNYEYSLIGYGRA